MYTCKEMTDVDEVYEKSKQQTNMQSIFYIVKH